jgi:uncharacterized protein YuzE
MKAKHVKLEYDSEVDAAYLTLARGRVTESEEVQPGVILDFDARDQVLGVEILRFSRRFKPRKANGRTSRPRRKPSAAAR